MFQILQILWRDLNYNLGVSFNVEARRVDPVAGRCHLCSIICGFPWISCLNIKEAYLYNPLLSQRNLLYLGFQEQSSSKLSLIAIGSGEFILDYPHSAGIIHNALFQRALSQKSAKCILMALRWILGFLRLPFDSDAQNLETCWNHEQIKVSNKTMIHEQIKV